MTTLLPLTGCCTDIPEQDRRDVQDAQEGKLDQELQQEAQQELVDLVVQAERPAASAKHWPGHQDGLQSLHVWNVENGLTPALRRCSYRPGCEINQSSCRIE